MHDGLYFLVMETKKKCSKCGTPKILYYFYKDKSTKDGHTGWCKDCCKKIDLARKRTKEGLVSIMYYNQCRHSERRGHLLPSYTKEELIYFAIDSIEFNNLYSNWVASGYNKMLSPSFDRKDDYKGYSFENFNKWMTWKDNKKKGEVDIRKGINNKNSSTVIAINITTQEEIEYFSISEADRKTGIDFRNISACCIGKRQSAGGYKWKYKKKRYE